MRSTHRASRGLAASGLIPTVVASALAALSVACAHGPAVARLTYASSPESGPPAPAVDAGPTVVVRPLADHRLEPKGVVVKVWNGRESYDVATPDDASAWVTGALRVELGRLGLRVVEPGEGGTSPVLTGEITETVCVAQVPAYQGRVTLRARLENGDERPLDRTYEGKGRSGSMWEPNAEVYERCLSDALRAAATRIAADTKTVLLGESLSPVPPPADAAAASGWKTAVTVVVVEGMLAGFSGLAARWPTQTGWVLATAWPVGLVNLPAGTTGLDIAMAGADFTAIGLYNALELRGDRYSRTERFWLNLGAWHAALLVNGAVNCLGGPRPSASKVALGVGVGVGGPALVVGGRF